MNEIFWLITGVLLVLLCLWRLLFGWPWNKPKPEPKPWDGCHNMKRLEHHTHWGDHPSEYSTGWIWQCTCGAAVNAPLWRLPYTAEQAVEEFLAHRRLMARVEEIRQ